MVIMEDRDDVGLMTSRNGRLSTAECVRQTPVKRAGQVINSLRPSNVKMDHDNDDDDDDDDDDD